MEKLFKKIMNSGWSGVLSLSLGTILSQGINLLTQPLLTRLLTPAELGQYSYILSIANLFIPIASLNMHLLIVTAKDESEAEKLTKLSIYSVCFVTIIYLIFITFSQVFTHYNIIDLFALLTINPLIIFTSGLYQIFTSRDNRKQKYSSIGRAEISKVGSMGIVQIISGILNFGVIGQLIGKLIAPFYYLKGNTHYIIESLQNISIKEYIDRIQKYFHHILYSVPSQFISSFSYSLIMLSIVSLYSAEEVGYYSVSVRVLGLPIILISYNLSKVYLQKISENKNKSQPLFKTFIRTVRKMIIISFLTFSAIAALAPRVTELIFGRGYEEAGYYIMILCIMFSVRLVTSSLNGTFIVVKKQNIQMFLEILFIIVGTLAYSLANLLSLDIYSYLFIISVSYAVVYMVILVYMAIQCKQWDKQNNLNVNDE